MLFVAGSANLDFVLRTPHIPAPGETVLGHSFQTFPGGKGANQALACARAGGATTHMLLALGDDAYASVIEASLRAGRVELHIVRVPTEATGAAFICVSDEAENSIAIASGANLFLEPGQLPPLTGFSHLLMQLETPLETVTAYARSAKEQRVKVILNAAPAQQLPAELLALVDVLVVNEQELSGISGAGGSVFQRLQRVDVPTVIVTLGQLGSCARQGDQFRVQPAYPVHAVDTTAAGDTFCGCIAAALDAGVSMAQALQLASAASALACTRAGAQTSIPQHTEVQRFLAQRLPGEAARETAQARQLLDFCRGS